MNEIKIKMFMFNNAYMQNAFMYAAAVIKIFTNNKALEIII